MPECDNCGAHVTPDFKRVFSDNDGVLHACTNCGRSTGLGTHDNISDR